jgi:methionyl-tRNA formyltransferase
LNITLLANRDLASHVALNKLLPSLAANHKPSVFLSSKVGGGQTLPLELQHLGEFEQGLIQTLRFPGLPTSMTSLNQINSEQGLATLRASEPDLVLSIRYGGILREQAIAIPRLGVINLHSGALPAYRGVMASFHAMLNGEKELGTSLHYISDSNIDTGAVLGQTRLPVKPEHSYLWHVLQLYPDACERLLELVDRLEQGHTLASKPQAQGGHYYSFPDLNSLEAFRKAGLKLYDVDEITALVHHYLE